MKGQDEEKKCREFILSIITNQCKEQDINRDATWRKGKHF